MLVPSRERAFHRKRGASRVRGDRRGGVLVLFVMLVFGFMALAALVVDLGLASATQGQMQGAVDMATLEAMRWRNVTPPPNSQPDFNEPIPFLTEDHRRARVRELVRLHFDDDLDPDGGDGDAYQVGPSLAMQGGLGPDDASALIQTAPQADLDDPVLELNRSSGTYNDAAGDMVSGTFDPDAAHAESSAYERADFTPAAGTTAASNGSAFLVRMRRSNEEPVAGSRSSGPSIPYLFGRGSLIGAGSDTSRTDGITVRATAIANAQPALRVGYLDPSATPVDGRAYGVVPFALRLTLWNTLDVTINDPECVQVLATGDIRLGGHSIGTFVEMVDTVGQEIVPVPPPVAPSSLELPLEGWVPIFTDILGTDRVIGFAFADLEAPDGCPPGTFSLSKRASAVALHNASALFPTEAPVLPKADWDLIFDRRKDIDQPLMAPALAR